jgi:hypothetical protein
MKQKVMTMAKGKTAPVVVEPELTLNRYGRASQYILQLGTDVDVELLAHKANLSVSAARYCKEAHEGVTAAYRLAGLLPPLPAGDDKPVEKAETVKEPIPAK